MSSVNKAVMLLSFIHAVLIEFVMSKNSLSSIILQPAVLLCCRKFKEQVICFWTVGVDVLLEVLI